MGALLESDIHTSLSNACLLIGSEEAVQAGIDEHAEETRQQYHHHVGVHSLSKAFIVEHVIKQSYVSLETHSAPVLPRRLPLAGWQTPSWPPPHPVTSASSSSLYATICARACHRRRHLTTSSRSSSPSLGM
jgi:hypothetical protein